MLDPLLFTAAILATFRISELLVVDAGPWDIFFRLRVWAGVYDTDGDEHQPSSFFGKLLDCPWCVGIYIAPLAILAAVYAPWLLWWPAVAGGQALLQKIGGRTL